MDVDTRDMVTCWLVTLTASAPVVLRHYDVDVPVGRAVHKKILFKNPWDAPRRFNVTSSDETVMRHR